MNRLLRTAHDILIGDTFQLLRVVKARQQSGRRHRPIIWAGQNESDKTVVEKDWRPAMHHGYSNSMITHLVSEVKALATRLASALNPTYLPTPAASLPKSLTMAAEP